MERDFIKIRGAKVHNLKNISLDIPKNKLVVITGLSGSGKSSLAFDTLYAEGQRRYVESLSAYARQFLGVMDKPDVEKIDGISPAIAIDQRKSAHNPRSTVGTITEIYDYIRLLFARIGKPHCPDCGKLISRQTIDQITSQILKLPKNFEITVMGPVARGKKGEHQATLQEIARAGFSKVRLNGDICSVEEALLKPMDKNRKHSIEAVVDRISLNKAVERSRLADSVETTLRLGKGIAVVQLNKISKKIQKLKEGAVEIYSREKRSKDIIFSEHFACEECGISLPELEPRIFSFNSPYGACPDCMGLGERLEVSPELVAPNENLTISEGAIWPWSKASHKVGRQGYYLLKLSELARRHNFSLDEPVKNLPPKILNVILRGDEEFEGVIPNLERRHRETDSDWTRREIERYMVVKRCEKCLGKRLKPEVLAVTVGGLSIDRIVEMPLGKTRDFFRDLEKNLTAPDQRVSQPIVKEIADRIQFLTDVGLDYLSLSRKAGTLAGGEEQRIRLATQIGSCLSGVMYILDEPSIGLHPRDQKRLIGTLFKLRDLGNTVIVVEHDAQTIMAADWVVEIGPGAGKRGGRVIFEGTSKQLLKSNALTGQYLSGRKEVGSAVLISDSHAHSSLRREADRRFLISDKNLDGEAQVVKFLTVKGAEENNLKNIDVKFPLGKFVCVTGVSGSGKSTVVSDILARALLKKFYRAKEEPGRHKEILGTEHINKAVLIDQSPIGRTPRSNPATYTGAFSRIRDVFSRTTEARIRGYAAGRFSFNVKGGRCEACEGQGVKKVEMYFLPDIYVECEECRGKRYNKEALGVSYKGKNIADVLQMTVEEAAEFFRNIPAIHEKLRTLKEVGLSYLELGQSATSLSGGEAQRIKLASELSRRDTGKTLYILDEPTTGLHFDDVRKLVSVIKNLVGRGNTVISIEHNLDFIKCVDWIVDLGPEGGVKGGDVVAEGTPEEIMKNKKSWTGRYLKVRKRG